MMRSWRHILISLFLVSVPFLAPNAGAQEVTQNLQGYELDTISLMVYFRRDISKVDTSYRDNARRIAEFKQTIDECLNNYYAVIQKITISGTASPEGPVLHNKDLADTRARNVGRYLDENLGLSSFMIRSEGNGEDWDGLKLAVQELDVPWRDTVLKIINSDPDTRKERLKKFEKGTVWKWLDTNIFPDLRTGAGVSCVVLRLPIREVVQLRPDTVFVTPETPEVAPVEEVAAIVDPFENKKMILALRTNFVAIPFTNVGVEVPIGEHWSVGADWYSPWLWRPRHKDYLDDNGWCFEFQAADIEARYWFTNKRKLDVQRLLGHSVGVYAAAGHYDFEQDRYGNQGEFWNLGADYLYAFPIFHNKMHVELELGLGFIHSTNQSYECLKLGDHLYRINGGRRIIDWLGVTRAQASLVWPIYVKKRKK